MSDTLDNMIDEALQEQMEVDGAEEVKHIYSSKSPIFHMPGPPQFFLSFIPYTLLKVMQTIIYIYLPTLSEIDEFILLDLNSPSAANKPGLIPGVILIASWAKEMCGPHLHFHSNPSMPIFHQNGTIRPLLIRQQPQLLLPLQTLP